MNILLVTGLAILLGIISGQLFRKIHFPQVVGYILLGFVIGKSFFHIFNTQFIDALFPVINLTLGIIGAVIGAELKLEVFKKAGKAIVWILLAEGLLAFVMVTVAIGLLTGQWEMGMILGAIASATDPASTMNVLWEYKARGPMSRVITSVIALDDALALMLYGLVIIFSKAMILREHFSIREGLLMPLMEIGFCIGLGTVAGLLAVNVIKKIKEEALVLSFILGMIVASVGISMALNLDLILSNMAFGATVANIIPNISEKLFSTIRQMATSLYILFFVMIGAQLDIKVFAGISILGIVVVYVLTRSAGKVLGCMWGAAMTGMPPAVRRYTGMCLFTQGGIAMGLALSIQNHLGPLGPTGQAIGATIINVAAATTFIVQLMGPPFVRLGIKKAGEMYRNVTREDIAASMKVSDVMFSDFQSIRTDEHLNDVIRVVRETDAFYYPVVDRSGVLSGVITIKELKEAMFQGELNDIVLAEDIAAPARFTISPSQSLNEASEIFDKRHLDAVPVVDPASQKAVGILEARHMSDQIDRKLLDITEAGMS